MARRSCTTRIMTLLWAPLAVTVALPVVAADRLAGPPPQARAAWLAQAKGEIPAQVQGWVDEAMAAYEKGNPAEALRLQQQALEWVRAHLAPAHPFRAEVLHNLGRFLSAVGRRQEALVLTEEAVRVFRDLVKTNPAHLGGLAVALSNLGASHSELGLPKKALGPTEEAVRTFRELAKTNPDDLGNLADSLSNFSTLLYQLGRRQEALAPTEEAVKVYRALVKTNPVLLSDLALALNKLGVIYSQLDRSQEGLAPTVEAVRIFRELAKTSPAHLGGLAMALNNLGDRYSNLGRRQEALDPTEEAVRMFRELAKTNPENLGNLALALNYLGGRYGDVGRPHEALTPTEEAVKIYRELVKTNPVYLGDLALALNNQGKIMSELGRRQEALAPTQEAVKVYQELVKKEPAYLGELAGVLNNSGAIYSQLGRHQEGLATTEEAVKVYRELVKTNPKYLSDLARALNNLSNRYSNLALREEALAPTEEAAKVYRELVKNEPVHLGELAGVLNNSGAIYSQLGRHQEGLATTEEAVKIYRELVKTNPVYLGDLALALNNQGKIMSELGRRQEALAPTQEAVRVYHELAKTNPAYLGDLARSTTNLANLQVALGNPDAAVASYREAMASEAQLLQQQLPLMPETRRQAMINTLGSRWQTPFSLSLQGTAGADLALFTRLNRHAPLQDIERRQGIAARATGPAREVLERLQAATAQLANPALPVAHRQQAEAASEQLQQELLQLLPALQPRLVEPSAVARQLPADGLLVEFQRYAPYDPRQPEAKQWGSPRYLALLLTPSGQIQAVDLGPAEALEQRIATALQHTRERAPAAPTDWGQVAEAVFAPLQGSLAGRRRLLIAPDGELHRVPFSALPLLVAGTGALPPELSLQTIGSGRDLMPLATAQAPTSAPLVLADPQTIGWPALPAADQEGAVVAGTLGVAVIRGPAARVEVLDQARSPRLIHVAGHAYFDDQASGDPLLASGLVLAGADQGRLPSRVAAEPANLTSAPVDDGYLTAKEAARLQLDGTDLVVLSACETGVGQQRTGEGVFGLQRALTVAGARGTLLSLWQVPDQASKTFMERFYSLLTQGQAPDQAVRQVQAEFRSQPTIGGKPKPNGWSDPFYWAAWQYSGVPNDARSAP